MVPLEFKFYKHAEETWSAMLEALRGAQMSIDIEHYIFDADGVGNKFIEILKEKTKVGIKVRILIDAVGSYGSYNSSLPEELRNFGMEVKFFNLISPWRIPNFTSWFFRDHRKIIIVDKKIGFTGGLGIRDNMIGWRDTNARMEGQVVEEMLQAFEEMWARPKNLISRIKRKSKNENHYFITNAPYYRKKFLYNRFIEALRSAKKSIYITNPYFIPDGRLIRVLRLAVARGVEVKVIVPESSDVPTLITASNSIFSELLRAGVKIYKYQPVFLHAKTAVVDDHWATFGSFNLDGLSFFFNFEANVVSMDKKCIQELKNHFEEDVLQSVEVKLEDWKKRPFIDKVREFFIGPIRGFL